MLRRAIVYLKSLPAVFIDGALYVMFAVLTANVAMLSSEDAKEFIGRKLLFFITWANVAMNAAVLSLKTFRSTAFADHKQQEKDETAMIARSFQGPKP